MHDMSPVIGLSLLIKDGAVETYLLRGSRILQYGQLAGNTKQFVSQES